MGKIKPEIDLKLSINSLHVYGVSIAIINNMLKNLQAIVDKNCEDCPYRKFQTQLNKLCEVIVLDEDVDIVAYQQYDKHGRVLRTGSVQYPAQR